MRSFFTVLALSLLSAASTASATPLVKRAGPQGIDVSHYQGSIDWATVASQGVAWAYIKATEGTTFIDPLFSQNYIGATNNGIIRGAYHFAHPDTSSGATQANYFLAHGGGWSGDGITLPGAIDLEGTCYGLTAAQMVSWIQDFSDTYQASTTRYPAIYTTTSWWASCTGNSAAFASTNPLWIAHWASTIGTLPAGWGSTTFWQYADSGPYPGDQDLFNGDAAGLSSIALG
ncbi:N,O-diacetylmuramidase [Multifurca ochricompacta]|uniref:Lysozyme n=1 Tax=Multifurca ochricompacta TaxID=376703 RepID=A0AAD4LTS2_9AGAM|nr:N,O-diacetylmuramidase [Multifurca ochricompacta]